jgi:hypothetical protein
MAKVSETYAGAFVTGAELLGQRRQAVIHQASLEAVGQDGTPPKIVLDLVSKQGHAWPRRVVLNKTNALLLASAYGDETDEWTGKSIDIWGEMVMFKGKPTPGIKLTPASAASSASPVERVAGQAAALISAPLSNAEALDEEIPF